jgi:hypothetical protein
MLLTIAYKCIRYIDPTNKYDYFKETLFFILISLPSLIYLLQLKYQDELDWKFIPNNRALYCVGFMVVSCLVLQSMDTLMITNQSVILIFKLFFKKF